MPLLIDGYNLLHAAGILGRGLGPGSLQRARLALLNFLAESLDAGEIPRTTVVFDAHDPPPGSLRKVTHRGLTVRFASEHDDADSLIEQLIRADSSPRRLTVVSSDHRLQRAARRRKATTVDSDAWYAEICRQRRQQQRARGDVSAKPPVPLLAEDVDYWIRQFGGESLLTRMIEEESASGTTERDRQAGEKPTLEEATPDKPTAEETANFDNPFPPGYAEDLLEGEELDEPWNPFPDGYADDVEDD